MINDDKINILLVDDRSENLLALEAIIEREEYNLIKAFSGEEALKHLLKYDFAAILLDVQMPGMDGFETAKIIKAREKTKNTPILFITANNMDSSHIFTGYSLGAIDYILKPFDPIILKSKVEGFVELYKMNQRLIQQADMLAEKTRELEKAYADLSNTASMLRVSEELANVISETSIDSMIMINQEGFILKVNPAVKSMFQYDELFILGKHISLFFSCDESIKYMNHVLEAINNLESIIGYENLKEITATRSDGTMFQAEIQIGKRIVKDQYIIACTIRDISKKKEYQELITHMAYHDSLTDLPNRRSFNDQFTKKINQARQNNQTLAIMYLDLDRFKYINDSLGHHIGDKVLKEISRRMQESIRKKDFAARIGGDEFIVLLPETDRETTLEIADVFLESIKKPLYIDKFELYLTTSIGISIFPYDGEDSLILMKNADAALYQAKEKGKNKYKVYHSGMNIQTYRSFILRNDLRKAIDRGEFSLVYQPRVNIESGKVQSAEALLRWNHSSWGAISPFEFIPLAEETDQIVEIGEWVLKSACQQIKAWQDAGLSPVRIAVNFSAHQFLQKDLVKYLERILNENDISPNLLEIEITESIIMGNESIITKALNQLRDLGVYISIDDFGTGYSSLNYLRRFPVNTLKIDKSFILDLTNSTSNSTAIVSTIITLAHSFDMTVVAEGVETVEQLNILRKYNCEEIQGYLFSPPVIPKKFETFIVRSSQIYPIIKNSSISHIENKQTLTKANTNANSFNDKLNIDKNQELLQAALYHIKELYSISAREMDVFQLIVKGLSNKEISDKLFISEHTVKNHITHIFQKLTVNDRLQAMAKIYQICIEEGRNLQIQ